MKRPGRMARIEMYVTDEQKLAITQLAQDNGLTVSEYMRRTALRGRPNKPQLKLVSDLSLAVRYLKASPPDTLNALKVILDIAKSA